MSEESIDKKKVRLYRWVAAIAMLIVAGGGERGSDWYRIVLPVDGRTGQEGRGLYSDAPTYNRLIASNLCNNGETCR